ncbi:hypothetical protein ACDQ55_05210 [Chitinophaga sp. 30R24]|uniref:hypothetical protein n=1 Tax=Chitinophaga sp. 30R24 TaxID=3248838 RepID=UPI003B907438
METPQYKEANMPTDMSIKEVILIVKDWCTYLLQKWVIILIFLVIGGTLGLLYALSKKSNYVAELSFVMEEGKSNTLGAYAGLASQFGIDLGGSGASGVFSGDNILEFLKTRLMVEKVLLSPAISDSTSISLGDLYIESSGLRKQWKHNRKLENLHLPIVTGERNLDLVQDSILFIIYKQLLKTNLSVAKPDKKLGFIIVKCLSTNQIFSKVFTERLVNEAIDFYVTTKTKRSKASVAVLQNKADSLEALLDKKTYAVAASQDLNLNPARRLATVGAELGSRDKVVLQTMYGEVLKNLELSKIAMAQETPLIQLVDLPRFPLPQERLGKLKGILFGGFFFSLIACMGLIIVKIYRNIMQ